MKVRELEGADRRYSAESHAAREAVKIYSQGYLAETTQRGAWSTAAAQVAGQVIGCPIGFAKGDRVYGLALEETVIATSVTLAKVAMIDVAGVIRAVSASAHVAFNAAIGEKLVDFLVPYDAAEDIALFACHLQVGGTPAAFIRGTGAAGAGGGAAINGAMPMGFQLAGQSDIGAVGTSINVSSVSAVRHWIAAY